MFGKSAGMLQNHERRHGDFPCGSVWLNWETRCRRLLRREEKSALRRTFEYIVSKQGQGNSLFSGLIWVKKNMPKGFSALGKICLLCFTLLFWFTVPGKALCDLPLVERLIRWSCKIIFFSSVWFLLWIQYLEFYSKSTYLQLEALPVFSFLIFTW